MSTAGRAGPTGGGTTSVRRIVFLTHFRQGVFR